MFNLCRYLLNSFDAAEDATHEVFLRAQRKLATSDRSFPFSSWLLGIASNHCIDLLRRRGTERRLFELEGSDGTEAPSKNPSPLGELLANEHGIVTVRGTVRGNVISIAQRTVTEGTVEGSVIGIGQSVQTRGQVDHNVYGFGQQVRTESPARIAGNAALIGQEISVDGNVERDVWVFGGRGDIQGNIARNLVVYAGAVTVLASAHVGGGI